MRGYATSRRRYAREGHQFEFEGYCFTESVLPLLDPPAGWTRCTTSFAGLIEPHDVVPTWVMDLLKLPGTGGHGPHELIDFFAWHREDREFLLGYAAVSRSLASIAVSAMEIADVIKRLMTARRPRHPTSLLVSGQQVFFFAHDDTANEKACR